jgi:enamine deaminase RidA (YjgF/YER057c/UK114 family)
VISGRSDTLWEGCGSVIADVVKATIYVVNTGEQHRSVSARQEFLTGTHARALVEVRTLRPLRFSSIEDKRIGAGKR